jgi:hypothetical protein
MPYKLFRRAAKPLPSTLDRVPQSRINDVDFLDVGNYTIMSFILWKFI